MPQPTAPSSGLVLSVGKLVGNARSVASELKRFRIYTIGDLLRVGGVPLFRALAGAVEWNEVRRWRTTAALLELDGMTLPLASALAQSGVRTVREVAELSLDDATTRFAAAATTAGEAAPSLALVADWLRDAVRLSLGSVVMGTVLDARGKPITGAIAHLGDFTAKTDRRGRFRLARLPNLSAALLHIEAKGYAGAGHAVGRPVPYEAAVVRVLRLRKRGRRASAARTLSELAGDRIAPSGWRAFATDTIAAPRVPSGEWVTLLTINHSEKKARLVSRLARVEGGTRKIVIYRVPLSALPDGMAPGADFLATPEGLRPAKFSPQKLAAYRRFLAQRTQVERPRLPRDEKARRRAVDRYLRALTRSGALGLRPTHKH